MRKAALQKGRQYKQKTAVNVPDKLFEAAFTESMVTVRQLHDLACRHQLKAYAA